ncbi:MAG: GldG family protein [Ruminococcus sp.]|uniref:Gldg family protein n=1 Tax=Ruminococcus sp. TaxID=41978 RepID=UPI0025DA1258|nr:Gldg family protein [Ruminococcus sp.]MCR5599663.1 GldG family protein [Ruminococcus sp.]
MSKKDIDETNVVSVDGEKVKKNYKKLKYGSMFYTIIILVVAIVVVLNFMVGVAAKRSPIKIDITPDNRYELSDVSIDAVKALEKDVEITVTCKRDYFESLGNYYSNMYAQYYGAPAEVPYEMIPELLDKYSIYAEQGKGSINVKYVDMDKDPDLVNKYKENYSGDIQRGNIIVSCGDRVRVLAESDVMNMLTADQTAMQSQQLIFKFTGESLLTSAITGVTDAHPVKVAFANKMNGSPLYDEQNFGDAADTFKTELLGKNGYECVDFDITLDDLKADEYDMIVVFAPTVDFTENIIQKLSDFLYNDGKYDRNMVYVPDFSKTNLPNIEEFLADWSLKVENNILVDEKNAIATATTIILSVSDSEAVGDLPNDKLPIVSPYTRELTQLKKNNEDVVKEVLKSSEEAFTADIVDSNAAQGEKGSRSAVLLSQKLRSEQLNTYTSSLLLIGSPYMFDRTVIQQNTTYNNANVLLNTINTMTGKENSVVVPDKNLQQSYISTTTKQAKNIQIIVVWVIPCIIALVGVFVLLRRRNK